MSKSEVYLSIWTNIKNKVKYQKNKQHINLLNLYELKKQSIILVIFVLFFLYKLSVVPSYDKQIQDNEREERGKQNQ